MGMTVEELSINQVDATNGFIENRLTLPYHDDELSSIQGVLIIDTVDAPVSVDLALETRAQNWVIPNMTMHLKSINVTLDVVIDKIYERPVFYLSDTGLDHIKNDWTIVGWEYTDEDSLRNIPKSVYAAYLTVEDLDLDHLVIDLVQSETFTDLSMMGDDRYETLSTFLTDPTVELVFDVDNGRVADFIDKFVQEENIEYAVYGFNDEVITVVDDFDEAKETLDDEIYGMFNDGYSVDEIVSDLEYYRGMYVDRQYYYMYGDGDTETDYQEVYYAIDADDVATMYDIWLSRSPDYDINDNEYED